MAGLLGEHGHGLVVIEPPDGLDLNTWARAHEGWAATLGRLLPETATPHRAETRVEARHVADVDLAWR